MEDHFRIKLGLLLIAVCMLTLIEGNPTRITVATDSEEAQHEHPVKGFSPRAWLSYDSQLCFAQYTGLYTTEQSNANCLKKCMELNKIGDKVANQIEKGYCATLSKLDALRCFCIFAPEISDDGTKKRPDGIVYSKSALEVQIRLLVENKKLLKMQNELQRKEIDLLAQYEQKTARKDNEHKNEVNEKQSSIVNLQQQNENLTKTIADLSTEKTKTEEEATRLRNLVVDLSKKQINLDHEISELKVQVVSGHSKTLEDLNKCEEREKALNIEKQELQEKFNSLQNDNTEMDKQLNELRTKVTSIEDANVNVANARAQLEKKLDEVDTARNDLETALSELQSSNKETQIRLEAAEATVAQLQSRGVVKTVIQAAQRKKTLAINSNEVPVTTETAKSESPSSNTKTQNEHKETEAAPAKDQKKRLTSVIRKATTLTKKTTANPSTNQPSYLPVTTEEPEQK